MKRTGAVTEELLWFRAIDFHGGQNFAVGIRYEKPPAIPIIIDTARLNSGGERTGPNSAPAVVHPPPGAGEGDLVERVGAIGYKVAVAEAGHNRQVEDPRDFTAIAAI